MGAVIAALLIAAPPAPPPIERRKAMERCAEAVIAARHPGMGMLDVTGTRFEGLQASAAGNEWVIAGSIVEPAAKRATARRFTCRTRGDRPPRISFGKQVRL